MTALACWARHLSALLSSSRHTPHHLFVVTVTLTMLVLSPRAGHAGLSTTGRWYSSFALPVIGTHAAVLRDPVGDSTKVLLVGAASAGESFGQGMATWTFVPGTQPALPHRDTTLVQIPGPDDSRQLFCGGHATLGDGRLLWIGGQRSSTVGTRTADIFNPSVAGTANAWSTTSLMAQERWYATATTLADGSVLASSGVRYNEMQVLGGSNDALLSSFTPLASADESFWACNTVSSYAQPPARTGHTATRDPISWMIIYGGDSTLAGAKASVVFACARTSDDSTWSWAMLPQIGDATLGLPALRSRHSAVGYDAGTLMFGGQDASGAALQDLWKGVVIYDTDNIWKWQWTALSATGGPSPRWGHSAVMDNAYPGGPRMLVWGGRRDANTLSADTLWAYDPTGAQWSAATVTSGSHPASREGHIAVFDPGRRNATNGTPVYHMVLFGGSTDATHVNGELWKLTRLEGATAYTWTQLSPSASPSGRTQAAACYDPGFDQMLMMGGDSNGPGSSGGYESDVWALSLRRLESSNDLWHQVTLKDYPDTQHPDSPARAGHTMLLQTNEVIARWPERFTVTSDSQDPGTWSTFENAGTWQEDYPYMFLLPSGKVFYGGRNHDQFPLPTLFNPATGTWNTPTTLAFSAAGAAVEYLPGKILRAGSHSDGDGTAGSSLTQIDTCGSNGEPTGWQTLSNSALAPRANLNLTLLPDGNVLATGGLFGSTTQNPERRPQIWDPLSLNWTPVGVLASDPLIRNYHSAAVLLPDARVLTTGGELNPGASTDDRFRVSVFEPPYLFNASGAYATRPAIDDTPQRIRYGEKFAICESLADGDSTTSACLIRPGATTHAYDQNQRYVPLSIDYVTPAKDRIETTAPADSFVAPPGDYLMFLINKSGVPAVARWVRVGSIYDQTQDTVRPAAVNDIYVEIVSQNALSVTWTSTGDDSLTGCPSQCDLRYSTSNITNDTQFYAANHASPQPIPACPGVEQTYRVSGLASNTTYYFAIKLMDESGHLSAMSNVCHGKTTSLGGGGGSYATSVSGRSEGGNAANATGTPGALIAAFEPSSDGVRWTLSRSSSDTLAGVEAWDRSSVLEQERDGAGTWKTRLRLEDWSGSLGFSSLPRSGRLVFLGGSDLTAIQSDPGAFHLNSATDAWHGGVLIDSVLAASLSSNVAAGDTVSLYYSRAATAADSAAAWFFLVSRSDAAASSEERRAGTEPFSPRLAFALRANRPNPFDRATEIGFTLPELSHVKLQIFDMQGRLVRTLANGMFQAGGHTLTWDRSVESGGLARPAVYWYRIDAGVHHARRKMVVL